MEKGLLRVAAGIAGGLVVMFGLGLSGRLLISPDVWASGVGPGLKARALGENISRLMDIAVFGMPVGFVAGILAELRQETDPTKN